MSVRGQKPKAAVLRLLTGNAGKRPLPPPDPVPSGSLIRPAKLRGVPGKLWDTFIAQCFWLTWADGPKAVMWCHLQAEFDSGPRKMVAARIAQLRALGSELGFDSASRTRMGLLMGALGNPNLKPEAPPGPSSTSEKYFK